MSVTIVGIKFKNSCKVYYFSPENISFSEGDAAIVETARGTEYGEVVLSNREVDDKDVVQPLKPVLRKATDADKKQVEKNLAMRPEAIRIANEKIEKHNLNMKLVDVEYTFDRQKIIFYFTAVNSYVPEDAGISGFQLFLRTIPYNLYAILTLVMVFYVIVANFDFGLMKKHEDNAAKGDLFTSGAEEFEQVKEEEVSTKGKVIDLVLPVAVLIVSAIGAMIYTGYLGGADNVVSAFAGCDAETSLIFATMVTVFVTLFLYLPRKVITFKDFMGSFVEGFKLMIPAIGILIFAWTLKGMGDALEIGTFVDNAFWAIMDSNITTFIAAIFLSQLGTGSIQGFAVTLAIGVISSVFTALFVSRLMFDFNTDVFKSTKVSIGWGL